VIKTQTVQSMCDPISLINIQTTSVSVKHILQKCGQYNLLTDVIIDNLTKGVLAALVHH